MHKSLGGSQVRFHKVSRKRIPEAIDEDEGQHNDAFPSSGGSIHDASSASCAASAARRMQALGTLAGRQVRRQQLEWSRAVLKHVSKLHTNRPASLEEGVLHRFSHEKAPRRLALLCKLEAARRQKRGNHSRTKNVALDGPMPSSETGGPSPSASLPFPTASITTFSSHQ